METVHTEILVIGGGPCGLGVATRLERLRADGTKVPDYLLVDARSTPGGWASSVTTPEGFTFDHGGHILFPHQNYSEFIDLISSLNGEWHRSIPRRGVWVGDNLVPYPIQANIQRLPLHQALSCLAGLAWSRTLRSGKRKQGHPGDETLGSLLRSRFGGPMTDMILGPLNEKMWAYPIDQLESSWVDFRSGSSKCNVAQASIWKLIRNMILRLDDPGWSDTTYVQYPLRGGTGGLWAKIAGRIPSGKLWLGNPLVRLDSGKRCAHLSDGTRINYGAVVSSIPLDSLLVSIQDCPDMMELARSLVWSSTALTGLGISGPMPERLAGIHSFHVPDRGIPFWRVTFPAALSPCNVPHGSGCWSVLCETSKPRASEPVFARSEKGIGAVEAGLRKMGILDSRHKIVSRWSTFLSHGYPTPFKGRDTILPVIHERLREINVWSRGRFGGWRYEISNQDHTFMQGVEVCNHLIRGTPEITYTW